MLGHRLKRSAGKFTEPAEGPPENVNLLFERFKPTSHSLERSRCHYSNCLRGLLDGVMGSAQAVAVNRGLVCEFWPVFQRRLDVGRARRELGPPPLCLRCPCEAGSRELIEVWDRAFKANE